MAFWGSLRIGDCEVFQRQIVRTQTLVFRKAADTYGSWRNKASSDATAQVSEVSQSEH